MAVCAKCGGGRIALMLVIPGYWREECRTCGSTGPFKPAPSPSVGATTSPAEGPASDA